MEKRSEELKLQINIPETVEIVKFIKTGENSYGSWYMWAVKQGGVEKVFFPSETAHKQLEGFSAGDTVVLLREQKPKDNGKGYYFADTVKPAFFDERGNTVVNKVEREQNGDERESRRQGLQEAYEDVFWVMSKVTEGDSLERERWFPADVVQRLATTLFIDRQR